MSLVEQLIQFMKQNLAVVMLAYREYSRSHSNFSSEVTSDKQSECLLKNSQLIFKKNELSLEIRAHFQ